MADQKKNPKVDEFLRDAGQWHEEFTLLRKMLLATGLTEELKWGVPCYALEGKNIALIHGFKEYCAILFVKGALLKDPQCILIQQTERVQAGRQIRFAGASEIKALEPVITAYLQEAIEAEKAGLEVEYRKHTDYEVPDELRTKFEELPALKAAFEALTPGRQRAYLLHFAEPKQAKTRLARVVKWIPQILNGKGMND